MIHRSCPSHCCPIHGCKYGYATCPVARGQVPPEYGGNNGCERCEADADEVRRVEAKGYVKLSDVVHRLRDWQAGTPSEHDELSAADFVEREFGG